MSLSRLKLSIIQQVNHCQDKELLQTINDLLQNLSKDLQSQKENITSPATMQKEWQQSDLDDLQSSIEEVFK